MRLCVLLSSNTCLGEGCAATFGTVPDVSGTDGDPNDCHLLNAETQQTTA